MGSLRRPPAYRHSGGANFGFADGHCERLVPADLGFTNVQTQNLNATETIVDPVRLESYLNLTTY